MTRPRRRLVLLLLTVGLLLVGWLTGWFLTRAPVVASVIAGRLSSLMGGTVSYESARWDETGRLEMTGFSLRVSDLEGLAGEVARVDRLLLDLSFSGLLGGGVVHGVAVDGATLRIAENLSTPWQYNLTRLSPESERGGPSNRPNILVSGLRLEIGTYDSEVADSWLLMGRANFSGEAIDDPSAAAYVFRLAELMVDPPREPLELEGRLGHDGNEVAIMVTGVRLDERFHSVMPAVTVRRLWEEFQLAGQVESISATFGPEEPARIVLAVADIDLVLPQTATTDEIWARYRGGTIIPITDSPLLHVDRGEIIFTGRTLQLKQLNGFVVAESQPTTMARVPYVINMEVRDLPPLSSLESGADLDSMLSSASIDLQLETRGFLFEQGGSADLPRQAAEIFALFGVESCVVDIKMAFQLEPDAVPGDSLSYTGRLSIRDASGAFQGFPYPLRTLNADITFDEKEIILEDLIARGSAESTVAMRGVVSNEAQPSVNIRLTATALPLDRLLVTAMPPEANSMMNSLFGRHGAAETAQAGRKARGHEHVGLDLMVRRDSGRDQETSLSGQITFQRLNLTWDGFPYPIRLGPGRLDWHGDTMDIESSDGQRAVTLTTDGGGDGLVRGVITLPSEDQAAAGHLELVVREDQIGETLLGALARISPKEATLLGDLGLTGTVNYAGELEVTPRGEPDYDLVVQLLDGQAVPRDAFAERIGLPGPLWPPGFQLDEVQANLIVSPGTVVIESLFGRNPETSLTLDGVVQADANPPVNLSLGLDGLPLSERVLQVFSPQRRPVVESIWQDWNAQGRITLDARITGEDDISGSITAVRLETPNGEVCRLAGGLIEFDPRAVRFQDLALAFRPPPSSEEEEWSLTVRGDMTRGSDAREQITVATQDGRFGSAFLQAVVANAMQESAAKTWRDLGMRGRFDGVLEVDSATPVGWELALTPRNVRVLHRNEVLEAEFTQSAVTFAGNGMAAGRVAGQSNFGEFEVKAQADFADDVGIDLEFDFDGRLGEPSARAILPGAVARALDDLQWDDGEMTRIRDGRLTLEFNEHGDPRRVALEAAVELRQAAMDFGVPVDAVNATATGRYHVQDSDPATLEATFQADSLRAAGRLVTGMGGTINLSDDASYLELSTDSAIIADGGMSATARIAIDSAAARSTTDADDWSATLLISHADLVQLFGGDGEPVVESEEDPVEGRVHMSLFVGGQGDDPVSRRGVGGIRITEAMLGDVPVVVGIQQMLHLTVPTLSRPDFVDIQYYLDGDHIVLQDILIESSIGEISVFSMRGEGTFDMDRGEIDAVLFPRGGLLLVDDLIGMVQDQLYAVRISGPIEDPDVGLVPFPGLR